MRAVWLLPFVLGACAAAPLPDSAPEATAADIETGQVEAAETPAADAPPGKKGLFALFRPALDDDAALSEAAGTEATGAARADVLETPEPAHPNVQAAARPLGGLFGGAKAKADKVPPGTALPFGAVARVCSARKSDLGKEVDRQGRWRLYDTIPNSAAPRVMYVTGFDDNCAQTFTAALVLFGSATAHETVRYTTRGPWSETDEEYEKIKGRICGVKRGSPCPADRIDKLESQVTFVTAYPGFGAEGGPWLDLLLHNGDLAASGLSGR